MYAVNVVARIFREKAFREELHPMQNGLSQQPRIRFFTSKIALPMR